MFSAPEIKELLNAQPFKPFRIRMSNGQAHEVLNHDMALVSRNSVDIGLHPDSEGVAERFVRCAILHITEIEELQAA
jgi:hypothetical protein